MLHCVYSWVHNVHPGMLVLPCVFVDNCYISVVAFFDNCYILRQRPMLRRCVCSIHQFHPRVFLVDSITHRFPVLDYNSSSLKTQMVFWRVKFFCGFSNLVISKKASLRQWSNAPCLFLSKRSPHHSLSLAGE